MNDQEILTILSEHLLENTTFEAVVLTQRDIGFKIIDKLVKGAVSNEILAYVKKTVEIQSYYSYFFETKDLDVLFGSIPLKNLEKLLPLYRNFVDLVNFFNDNYDKLGFDRYEPYMNKEKLKDKVEEISYKYKQYKKEFNKIGTINFDINDFNSMEGFLKIAYPILLKEDLLNKFLEEFGAASDKLINIYPLVLQNSWGKNKRGN